MVAGDDNAFCHSYLMLMSEDQCPAPVNQLGGDLAAHVQAVIRLNGKIVVVVGVQEQEVAPLYRRV